MYCGGCLRDNALVAALRKLGHQALLVPLYLPLTLDEEDQSAGTPLFFGGISVYLEQKSPLALQYNFRRLVDSWDKGTDPICRNAPHLIIAYCRKEDRVASGDATIALAHLELVVPAFGLGACWAGYFAIAASASQELKNLIELPQDHVVSGALMIGYPKYNYVRVPKRNSASVMWK